MYRLEKADDMEKSGEHQGTVPTVLPICGDKACPPVLQVTGDLNWTVHGGNHDTTKPLV